MHVSVFIKESLWMYRADGSIKIAQEWLQGMATNYVQTPLSPHIISVYRAFGPSSQDVVQFDYIYM